MLNQCIGDLNTDSRLGICLFGYAKLTKNADVDKYKCSIYSIGTFIYSSSHGEKCHYFWSLCELICSY